jgi:hypothetical protein
MNSLSDRHERSLAASLGSCLERQRAVHEAMLGDADGRA